MCIISEPTAAVERWLTIDRVTKPAILHSRSQCSISIQKWLLFEEILQQHTVIVCLFCSVVTGKYAVLILMMIFLKNLLKCLSRLRFPYTGYKTPL